MTEKLPDIRFRAEVDELANQLCVTVDDRFDFTVQVGGNDELIEKLQMLVNFTLDAARRAMRQSEINGEQLARSNRDLEHFAYVASHDLQAPLRTIMTYSQLLQRRSQQSADKESVGFVTHIMRNAQRMGNLINDLLEYAKVDQPAKPPELVDCSKAFQEAVENLDSMIKEHQAEVTSDRLPAVLANRSQLTRLFQNLIGNGVKFGGEESPRVHVSATHKNGGVLFEFRDNGIGIPEEFIGKLFMLFQRLHDESKYSGSGLGLAICKKIVDGHEGKIWVESQPGVGSRFYVFLPKAKSGLLFSDLHQELPIPRR